MSEFIKGKIYTPDEVLAMHGPGWLTGVYEANTFTPPSKSIVNVFSELEENAKTIYLQVYQAVKEVNPNEDFQVLVTGGYVNGAWITKSEAEQYSQDYNKSILPTPYDYWTTAKIYPSRFVLDNISTDVPIRLNPGTGGNSVIIPSTNS
jgi:hypothetical protein